MLRACAAVAAAVLVALAAAGVAHGHANLVRSEPPAGAVLDEPPTALRLWFSEPPELRFSEVMLLDRTSQRADGVGPLRADPANPGLAVAPLQPLPPGFYTVRWRVLSALDGHITAGAFAFAVGRDQVPPENPSNALGALGTAAAAEPNLGVVLVRWLGYVATVVVVGIFAFWAVVLWPALMAAGSSGRPGRRNHSARAAREMSALGGLLLQAAAVGVTLAVATTVVAALAQAAASAGVDLWAALGGPLAALLGGTRYGLLFWLRVLLLAALGGLVWQAWRRGVRMGRPPARGWWWAGLTLGLLVLLVSSLGSHAAAHPDGALAIVADWLHFAGVGVWVGGLVALVLVLSHHSRWGAALPAATLARTVTRFSQLALAAVALIVATGAYRAVGEVGAWDNLWDTLYGTALLYKLGLMALLLGLAALNLLVVQRRLARAAAARQPDRAAQIWRGRIRQTVTGELLLAAAILVATGVLTALPPARDAFGPGLILRGQAEGLKLLLRVAPGEPGLNTFDVWVRDRADRPVADAEKVAIVFTMVEHDMGETEAVARHAGNGHYVVDGSFVAMVGTWRVRVLVRRPGQDDGRATLVFRPKEGPVVAPTGRAGPPRGLVLGLGLVALGVLLVLAAARARRTWVWARYFAAAVGLAVAVTGLSGVAAGLLGRDTVQVNPFRADPTVLQRGREVYAEHCAVCHGPEGRGDGPLAATLSPPPGDLRPHVLGHSEGVLFGIISRGLAGTAMPGFGERLSPDDHWHVLNYLRSAFDPRFSDRGFGGR